MNNSLVPSRMLRVRRGTKELAPDKSTLDLPMDLIDEADRRLHEVRLVNTATANELKGLMNEACNAASKYRSWIAYEILKAEKELQLSRATVFLEVVPAETIRLKESGVKMNEDMREALVARDADCQYALDVLNSLKAVDAIMDSHYWTFMRAYKSIEEITSRKGNTPTPNFTSGHIGQTFDVPQVNIMGKDERKKDG